jgi:hypothetical protein
MNALKQDFFQPQPPTSPRRMGRPRRAERFNPHQAIVTETGVKLVVNLFLGLVAASALVRLVPYALAQQTSYQELEARVSEAERRVNRLQADLSHHFAPEQAMSVMQEESARIDERERRIVWIDSASPIATQGDATNVALQNRTSVP